MAPHSFITMQISTCQNVDQYFLRRYSSWYPFSFSTSWRYIRTVWIHHGWPSRCNGQVTLKALVPRWENQWSWPPFQSLLWWNWHKGWQHENVRRLRLIETKKQPGKRKWQVIKIANVSRRSILQNWISANERLFFDWCLEKYVKWCIRHRARTMRQCNVRTTQFS